MGDAVRLDPDIPVRSPPGGQSRELVDALNAVGYTAGGVCDRLGIDSIFDYETLPAEEAAPERLEDTVDALIHLLLAGRPLPREEFATLVPAGLAAILAAHGLTAPDPEDSTRVAAAVLFYPVDGLHVASDIARVPLRPDAVYPAIAANTGELLKLLPDDACESFLDLCSGTGVAALIAARRAVRAPAGGAPAGHAWAVDVTERATRFAEFNAAVNDISNVTVLRGDLWTPIADLTFDRIVTHPPYVPTVESDMIYRAGGDDGEQVTRRIISGLVDHLRPGGRFLCSCMLSDRRDAPVESRLRTMLGPAGRAFDVYVLTKATSTPEQYFDRHSTGSNAPAADAGLVARLKSLGVERLVLCILVIDRHDGDRPAATARRQLGERTGLAEIDWLTEWERAAADPDLPRRILDSRLRISPAVRLEVVSRPGDADWVPERCRLRTDWPFPRVIEVPVEIAQFLVGCDGRLSVAAHRPRAARAGVIPTGMNDLAFATSLLPLIGSGVLTLE